MKNENFCVVTFIISQFPIKWEVFYFKFLSVTVENIGCGDSIAKKFNYIHIKSYQIILAS